MNSTAPTARPIDKRVMIVTGASSGIGRSLAKRAAAHGWAVLLVARRGDLLEEAAREIERSGGSCATLTADVTAKDAPQKITSAALARFGRIDVLVNNAGVGASGGLLEQSDAALDAQWQLHVAAPLRIVRATLSAIRERQGGFVFFGSGLARVPAPGWGAYCAAKAAARATAIQLRRELRREGMFVTYVDPGAVATEFNEASGMVAQAGAPHASPDAVAKNILRAIEHRAARVNAVPWQTVGTVLGEWFPALADAVMDRIVATPTLPASPPSEPPVTIEQRAGLDAALEPVARRMERVKLPETFVRGLLVPGASIALHDAAMRWAGMPNKNERAAMHEVLEQLAASGYLERTGEETWTVLRGAD